MCDLTLSFVLFGWAAQRMHSISYGVKQGAVDAVNNPYRENAQEEEEAGEGWRSSALAQGAWRQGQALMYFQLPSLPSQFLQWEQSRSIPLSYQILLSNFILKKKKKKLKGFLWNWILSLEGASLLETGVWRLERLEPLTADLSVSHGTVSSCSSLMII